MAMREFLEGECGQLNPILKVASHFTKDASLRESLAAGSGITAAAAAAAFSVGSSSRTPEHLHAHLPPTTFRMDSILQEINTLDSQSDKADEWAGQFIGDHQNTQMSATAWTEEYIAPDLSPVWSRSNQRNTYPTQANHFQQNLPADHLMLQSSQDLLHDSKWVSDFSVISDVNTISDQSLLMQTADGLIKSVSDPTIKATDFMKYVEKLSSGEVKLNSSNGQDQDASLQWADEYDFQFGTTDASSDWANSFAGQEDLGPGPSAQQTTNTKADFWQNLEEEWERLAQEDAAAHPWLAESTSELNQAYTFNETNPFQEAINPLEEGKIRLREGDLPSAVLAFEAAVQKSPDNPECWLLLGSTQAQNEQDPLAISALNKCLELEPNNLSGLMNLAASLTNESYQLQACNALKNWLRYNPKYSHLVPDDIPSPTNSGVSTMLPSSELNHVQKLFVKAARLNPTTSVDADVQSGLGILFNLSSDYDRAADCFQAALSVTPNDSLLWNRMGATLANGGKSTEAIGAYRRALEISPGFIRTRYNLGISCVNLGAYREAAEHFLSSLNQQAAGRPSATGNSVNSKSNVVSNSIWASLRMILHLMDRSELSPAVDSRDLSRLNREFNIQQ